jgi:PAS domain S-box-containing protein
MREYCTITKGGLSNAAVLATLRKNIFRFLIEKPNKAKKILTQIAFADDSLALSANELTMLRKAVEASGEVIFMTDQEGVITYINPEFSRIYGYESPEVIGKTTPRILKSGKMSPQDYEQFWSRLNNKEIVRGEFINKCKNGNLVMVEGSANPILDERGNIIGFLAIQRDITERLGNKEALESAVAFQQSILDGIDYSIMVIGTDYRIILMNAAARRFAANGSGTDPQLYCFQVSHQRDMPCDGSDHPCPLAQVQKSRQSLTVEHKHYQANGELRCVEVIASPLWSKDGSFQGVIESIRDITERMKSNDQLRQYSWRLRTLASKTADVVEAERQHLAQELHDQVGQKLTVLGINLNIVQSKLSPDVDKSIQFYLEDSILLVEQTTERIRDVMANLRPPLLDDYGLIAALRWFCDQFTRRTNIAASVVGKETEARLAPRVENALFRIAQEAITNIAKHAQASKLTVKLEATETSFQLVITDDGIGFDTTKSSEPNDELGWGLLTMAERAEAVGGQCSIVSASGRGTMVIVDVPL